MLNFFRQRAALVKIVFGVVLVLICISMVVTLIPGLTGLESDEGSTDVVAKVGKDHISSQDLQQQIQQMARTNTIPPDMMSLYVPQILDQIIMDKVITQEASREGLSVSQQELRSRLQQVPDLFPNGHFVGQEQYAAMVESRFGTSVEEFEQRFRDAILTEKLRFLVTDPVTVSDDEVHKAFVQDNEKMVLKYVFLDPQKLEKDITPTDAALQEYFQKNHDRYSIPEKRTAQILMLNSDSIRQGITITDADRRNYYQEHMDEFRIPERAEVQHILLKASPQDKAQMDAARAKAEDLLKQLKAGADFGELAKKNSQDTGSAPQGGNLGWIVRGQTVPAFEKAAFSLSPGTISGPVQTEYGIHIIKVLAHEQAHVRSLQEAQGDIDKAILDERGQGALDEASQRAAADLRKDPQNLAAVGAKYHALVLTPSPLSQDDKIPGLTNSAPVLEEIFGLTKGQAGGQVGQPVAVDNGYAIPVLMTIAPAHPASFAEAADRVRKDYIAEQAKDKATAKALELAQTVEKQGDNRDLERAAKSLGLTSTTTEPLTRSGSIPSVGSVTDLGTALDTLQPGQTAGPISIAGGQIVYQLMSRQAPNEQDYAAQKETIRQRLLTQKQDVAFGIYEQDLRRKLTSSGQITIDQGVLARLTSEESH